MAGEGKTALDRYKIKPFFGSSHSWAIGIASALPIESAILDIGCGSAPLGIALKERGFQELYAVEIDEAARENAHSIYKTVTTDIHEFNHKKFDLVLLLDVMEHLPNPEQYLQLVSKLLRDGGILLISVPNVAHWSVRIPLLFGFFNYTDRAILDRTHLKFFTRRSLIKLIQKFPELQIAQKSATIEPAEFVLPKIIWNNDIFKAISKMRLTMAKLLPGLLAYQHVAMIRKKGA